MKVLTKKPIAPPARPQWAEPGTGRVTIHDVARVCGVSKATVSKALSPSPASRLSQHTRQRVIDAASKLGYRASSFARGLSQQKTHSIGLVFSRATPMLFGAYEHLASAIAQTLRAYEYHLLFIPVYGKAEEVREVLAEQRVDACLVMQPATTSLLANLAAFNLPTVLINEQADVDLPQILMDDVGGMDQLMTHLFELGHRAITFFHGDHVGQHYSYSLRERAFLDAMRLAGHSGGADVFVGAADQLVADIRAGRRASTAVVSFNSQVGFDVLCAAWRHGVRMPADLSLASFDDSDPFRRAVPAPTVVDVPMQEAGRRAVEVLIAHAERGEALHAGRIVLPERLIVRESTGPAPRRD